MPHDSTIGVGPGWYWFSLAVIIFIALGVGKVALEERGWKGRTITFDKINEAALRRKQKDVAERINAMTPDERKAFKDYLSKRKKN